MITIRTAPQVDDLRELKKFINLIAFYKIPYTDLEKRKLDKQREKGIVSENLFQQIMNWKEANQIRDAMGWLSEIFSLLDSLGIITKLNLNQDDLDTPLCDNGPLLKDITNKKLSKTAILTNDGYDLFSLISDASEENKKEYDAKLFWLILRSEIYPVWQRLIERKEIFSSKSVKTAINEIGVNDGQTRNLFFKWSKYFDLFDYESSVNRGEIFDKKKIALKLLYSTIFELNSNFISKNGYDVEDLVNKISEKFQNLSKLSVNFLNILEIIFDVADRENIEGSPVARGGVSLPNHTKVSILKIKSKIPIFPNFRSISDEALLSCGGQW